MGVNRRLPSPNMSVALYVAIANVVQPETVIRWRMQGYRRVKKTVFELDELRALKAIYEDITAEDWFDPAANEDFARYLIETCPDIGAMKRHRSVAEASARMFYSLPPETAQAVGWL